MIVANRWEILLWMDTAKTGAQCIEHFDSSIASDTIFFLNASDYAMHVAFKIACRGIKRIPAIQVIEEISFDRKQLVIVSSVSIHICSQIIQYCPRSLLSCLQV